MVDEGAAAVGFGDAVVDEAFVQWRGRERAVLGQPVGGSRRRPTPLSVSYMGHAVFQGGTRQAADLGVASCWSVGCLPVWLAAGLFLLAVDVAGWLGGLGDRVGSGQAEFFGPALDVRARAGGPRGGRVRRWCRPGSSR